MRAASGSPGPPDATSLAVLDVTECWAGESGGIRTYLAAKSRHVEAHTELRQVLVVPGERTRVVEGARVRRYELYGPRIPGQPPYRFLLAGRELARIARRERPDVIEAGSPGIAAWLASSAGCARGAPRAARIWFYHASLGGLAAGGGRVAARASRAYLRALARRYDAVVASSRFCESELVDSGVRAVHRVPLGVDLELFHPRRRARGKATRARLGLGAGLLVLYCGRFAREKELELVLDAWPGVARETGAELVLAGSGPRETGLRARASDGVRFLAFEEDRARLADLHAAADVYLSPCPIESFGLAALEAQASGTPLFSADGGGVAERVLRSGAGRLYAAGERDSFTREATALLSLSGAARASLGARARADAEREHAWERVFERLFEVYRVVLGR